MIREDKVADEPDVVKFDLARIGLEAGSPSQWLHCKDAFKIN